MKPMVNGETNGIVSLGFKIIFKTFENFLNVKIYLLLPLSGEAFSYLWELHGDWV